MPGKGLNFVSEKGGFIFMTCPKAAGTSIRTAILQFEGEKNPKDVHSSERGKLYRNDQIVDFPHFRFTFVRNPFDRVISCYEDKVKGGYKKFQLRYQMRPDMSFREFVRNLRGTKDKGADPHIQSQVRILSLEDEVLPDWTGYYENIERDWEELKQILRLQNELNDLPVRNAKTQQSRDAYYENDELIRLVRERYENDLEIFGYDYPG